MEINTDGENLMRAKLFFENYSLELIEDTHQLSRKKYLGDRDKTCRFCKEKYPKVGFKKDAHVIPEFFGSRYLLSNFECDSCNDVFSKYEDSFANFLGAYRTISQIKGKRKVPKFKDNKNDIVIQNTEDNKINFISSEVPNLDPKKAVNKIQLQTTIKPYIPIHVFKLLLKIGLCLIPYEDVNKFDKALEFVINESEGKETLNSDWLRSWGYFIPGPTMIKKPIVKLFRKIEPERRIPERLFIIETGNFVLQIIIILNENDKTLGANNEKLEIPIYPLLIDNKWFDKYGLYQKKVFKLSSWERTRDDSQNLEIEVVNLKDLRKG